MEPFPEKEIGGLESFKVLLHPHVKHDLARLHTQEAEEILNVLAKRLAMSPQHVGVPLKGTFNRLWKFRIRKTRTVYTINQKGREVWILAIQPRDIVYRPQHLESLLRLALAIQGS